MRATVSARLVRPLLENEALAAIYADEARRLGLTLADLQAPDARVDHQIVVGLVAAAERKTGSTSIGIHGAMFFGTGVYHVLDYLVRTSANVFEALKRVGRYYRLFHDAFVLDVERRGDADVLFLGMKKGVAFPGAIADFCMASLILGGYNMGLPPMARGVFFTHPTPRNVAKFESVFRVPVHFGAEKDYAVFRPGAFDVPLPQADPVLCSLLARHADKLLERAAPTPPLIERVRRAIANELRGGLPTVAQIAPAVGIPERTLRRRLEHEGVSFQGILDDMRRELALSYLEQPDIELEEAAYLLGYSEASAFRRAFKRWTGKSVTEFRRR